MDRVGSLYQLGWRGDYYLAVKSLDDEGENLLFSSQFNMNKGGASSLSHRMVDRILPFNRLTPDSLFEDSLFTQNNLINVGSVEVGSRRSLDKRITEFVLISDETREVVDAHLKGEPVFIVLPSNFSSRYQF